MTLNLHEILQQVLNESVSQANATDAIQNKQVVMIQYNDEQDNPQLGKRWVEPYSLVTLPSGNLAIRGFQYNGATRRGIPKWKLFRLDRITSWQPTTSHFVATREGYNNMGDKQYPVITQLQLNQNDLNIQRNIQHSNQQNIQNNVDYFGRNINRKQNKSSQTINISSQDKDIQDIFNNPTSPGFENKEKLQQDRKRAWKNFYNLNYQKQKRDAHKLTKNQEEIFGDVNDNEENVNNQEKKQNNGNIRTTTTN